MNGDQETISRSKAEGREGGGGGGGERCHCDPERISNEIERRGRAGGTANSVDWIWLERMFQHQRSDSLMMKYFEVIITRFIYLVTQALLI